VKAVNVDLEKKLVTIQTKQGQTIDDAKIKKLLGNAGYSVVTAFWGYHLNQSRAERISNAIDYAKHRSRSHHAVIRVYDEAGNVIETTRARG
jgi:hypothetical protein